MILVIGATGQLGTAVVRRLAGQGQRVRAFVRPTSNADHLKIANVELASGDLRNASSVDAACKGADVIIATANTVAPSGAYSFNDVEGQGYRHLVDAAARERVSQFVFMSVPLTPYDETVPTFRYKRLIEKMIIASGVPYTIFRGSLFMDDWFALIGSSIPLRGAESATLKRPFWFSQAFMKGVGHLIENHGIALIPGTGTTRHAFITLDDVASFITASVGRPDALNAIMEIGGPKIMSLNEVAELFGTVLGKRIKVIRSPAAVFRLQQRLLDPISPAAANLMGMNWMISSTESAYDMTTLAPKYGITLTTPEQFLREKSALPA